MKVREFILATGFKRRSKRSRFYDIEYDGIKYTYKHVDHCSYAVDENKTGYGMTMLCGDFVPDEHSFLSDLSFCENLKPLCSYLTNKIRKDIIDSILYDLR